MSIEQSEPGHGDSPAAWTAVVVMLLGFALGTLALFLDWYPVVYIAGVVVLVGLLIGWLMKKAGFGVGGHRYVRKSHD